MSDIHEHGTPAIALRVEALESLLQEKGLIHPAAVDGVIRYFEQDIEVAAGDVVATDVGTEIAGLNDFRVGLTQRSVPLPRRRHDSRSNTAYPSASCCCRASST